MWYYIHTWIWVIVAAVIPPFFMGSPGNNMLVNNVKGVLLGIWRQYLRSKCQYDKQDGKWPVASRKARTYSYANDGSGIDLDTPCMGMVGTHFSRMCPNTMNFERKDNPPAVDVANKLLTRHKFKPQSNMSQLAVAWIQFQLHGWINHGTFDFKKTLKLETCPFKVPKTPNQVTLSDGSKAYTNTNGPWWDMRQLYGGVSFERPDKIMHVRTGKRGHIYPSKIAFDTNVWPGLALMHKLWSLEHNRVCNQFHRMYPAWSDEELFEHARLCITAVNVKIHVSEWSVVINYGKVNKKGGRINWFGLFDDTVPFRHVLNSAVTKMSGIESRAHDKKPYNHHGSPYSVSEEFVSAYRMHELVADSIKVVERDGKVTKHSLKDVLFGKASGLVEKQMEALIRGLGQQAAGQFEVNNFPNALRKLKLQNGHTIDLAVVDIIRDRERGVAAYNDLRESMGLARLTFEQLAGHHGSSFVNDLKALYHNDVDLISSFIGMRIEPKADNFLFGETARGVFLLHSSRRVHSNRFLCEDFTPEVYTQWGIDYVDRTTFRDVVISHFPALKPEFDSVHNGFFQWKL